MNVPEPHGDSSVPQSTGMPAKDDASDTANNRTVINAFKQKAEFSPSGGLSSNYFFSGEDCFPPPEGARPSSPRLKLSPAFSGGIEVHAATAVF